MASETRISPVSRQFLLWSNVVPNSKQSYHSNSRCPKWLSATQPSTCLAVTCLPIYHELKKIRGLTRYKWSALCHFSKISKKLTSKRRKVDFEVQPKKGLNLWWGWQWQYMKSRWREVGMVIEPGSRQSNQARLSFYNQLPNHLHTAPPQPTSSAPWLQ